MSRPDDIPEDIWAAAERVGEAIHGRHERGWVAWPLITEAGTDGPQKIVARAILAERERCAVIAEAGSGEGTFGTNRGIEYLAGYVDGRHASGAAIRGGK